MEDKLIEVKIPHLKYLIKNINELSALFSSSFTISKKEFSYRIESYKKTYYLFYGLKTFKHCYPINIKKGVVIIEKIALRTLKQLINSHIFETQYRAIKYFKISSYNINYFPEKIKNYIKILKNIYKKKAKLNKSITISTFLMLDKNFLHTRPSTTIDYDANFDQITLRKYNPPLIYNMIRGSIKYLIIANDNTVYLNGNTIKTKFLENFLKKAILLNAYTS